MKPDETFESDLASIHRLMERSVKFVSLSGLSGILIGVYSLLGAGIVYYVLHYPASLWTASSYTIADLAGVSDILLVAFAVLVLSLGTVMWLSAGRAKRMGVSVWGAPGRRLLINLGIPLVVGGIFSLLCLIQGHAELVAPATLIFYGLALVNASPNLYDEVRYLGFLEIGMGLVSMIAQDYSLLFWAGGFGALHILYGSILYRKYE